MPELPEVEILRLGLEKYVSGARVSGVEVRTPKMLMGNKNKLIGGRVEGIRRFGKMLAIDLSNGYSMAVHVKMTGRLIYRGLKQPRNIEVDEELQSLPGKHTHVVFLLEKEDKLYFNDVRKFGWIRVVKTDEIEKLSFVKQLGPEPLNGFSITNFLNLLSKTTRPIKTLLMDQQKISGVGNIYANEALFCAMILPNRPANKLSEAEAFGLLACIKKVLLDGLKYGGSSTDSFRNVLGERGTYQNRYFVYNREKFSCLRKGCRGTIKKSKLSGRGTYFCSVCQK